MKKLLFIALITTSILEARIGQLRYEGVRQVGMGNAALALADDANAIWYNPAGLAYIKGVHVNLFNTIVGADSDNTLTRAYNAFFKGDSKNLIRTDREYLRFNIMPSVVMPCFGFAFYEHANGFTDLSALTSLNLTQELQAVGYNDLGAIAALAIPFGEYFSIGASARIFQRTGTDIAISAQDFINANATNIQSILNNSYEMIKNQTGSGAGLGLNAGVLAQIPLRTKTSQLYAAATVEDFGNTTFRKITAASAPSSIKQTYNLGVALKTHVNKRIQWNNAIDYRNYFDANPVIRHVHFGTEIRHDLFGVRLGLYQGYPTFGISIEMPPHTRLHFSSYAVEVGNGAMNRMNRWYVGQLIIGFNPF